MSRNARGIVIVVFTILALSFLTTTAVLIHEFQNDNWFGIASFYSHLFLFFPTLGILALFAFYLPAAALLDLCLHHHRGGKVLIAAITAAIVAASAGLTGLLLDGAPAFWWLKPATLESDQGRPAGCQAPGCARLPILESLREVQLQSQKRMGLSPFVRNCDTYALMETPPEQLQKRYCFVTKTKLTALECCRAQETFTSDITTLFNAEPEHSVTGKVHAALLPLKIFFLLMVLAIGVLLAMYRRSIDKHYKAYAGRIERGIMVGAIAMVVWPIANQSFLQSSTLLYGRAGEGLYASISPVMSLLFIGWAWMLVLFYFRQHQRDVEAAGRIGGAVASAVAFLKYNELVDYATRYIGSGAHAHELAGMAIFLVILFAGLYIGIPVDQPKPKTTLVLRQKQKKAAGERP